MSTDKKVWKDIDLDTKMLAIKQYKGEKKCAHRPTACASISTSTPHRHGAGLANASQLGEYKRVSDAPVMGPADTHSFSEERWGKHKGNAFFTGTVIPGPCSPSCLSSSTMLINWRAVSHLQSDCHFPLSTLEHILLTPLLLSCIFVNKRALFSYSKPCSGVLCLPAPIRAPHKKKWMLSKKSMLLFQFS